ncbi:hypothetical protein RRF57_011380 [Xylaria bambusicola]|uniref:Uncharacterized protein n=1 Tax=Xylaria bambusicola TaxID=326684 RepID=A0AAN7UUT4_9PEZI
MVSRKQTKSARSGPSGGRELAVNSRRSVSTEEPAYTNAASSSTWTPGSLGGGGPDCIAGVLGRRGQFC